MNVEYSLLAGGAAAGAYVYYTQSGGLPLDPTGTLLVGALGAFVWEYASIAWKVGSPRPGKVLGEFVNEVVQETVQDVPMVINIIIAQMPTIINAVLKEFPIILDALLKAIPQVIDVALQAAPKIVESVVAEIPKVVVAVAKETPVLVKEVIKEIPEIVSAIAGKGIGEVVEVGADIATVGVDLLTTGSVSLRTSREHQLAVWAHPEDASSFDKEMTEINPDYEDKLYMWDKQAAGDHRFRKGGNMPIRPDEETMTAIRQYVKVWSDNIHKNAEGGMMQNIFRQDPEEKRLLDIARAKEKAFHDRYYKDIEAKMKAALPSFMR